MRNSLKHTMAIQETPCSICSCIRPAEQQDFNVIGKLSKDYFKKYNRNKQFRKELSEMQK